MSARSARRTASRTRTPQPPQIPAFLEPATLPEHDLEPEAIFYRLAFELNLTGRVADVVVFDQCRFQGADLSGTVLERARFTHCHIDRSNFANVRAEKSALQCARFTASRLTGLHWPDGTLRDVVISGCRADLAAFRFTTFRRVVFEDCNLAGADFSHADLSGTRFLDCDLTGAQFSQATMTGAYFRGCTLTGVGGITSFAGARITGHDLIALSYTLASALGIEIGDDEADDEATD